MNMDTNRIAHKVFLWDLHLTEHYRNIWCGDVKTILHECDLFYLFNTDLSRTISAKNLVDNVKQKLINIRERQWNDSSFAVSKTKNIPDIQILDW